MRSSLLVVSLFTFPFMLGCGANLSQSTASSSGSSGSSGSASSSATTGAVNIAGGKLLRDGTPWVPKSLQLNAFVASPAVATGVYLQASQNYSPAELAALQTWNADTVRFQVGQPELDPQSSLYSAVFVSSLTSAVVAARALGLNVIVSMQDQAQTGDPAPAALPNAATLRAWTTLTTAFNADLGILYELFNEPNLIVGPANWIAWQTAHQALINGIRATGSHNVLLVEGLRAGMVLQGAPALSDPLAQLGYAVHPFFFPDYHTTADFDANFGLFAASNVVVVTEWSTLTGTYPEYCGPTTPTDAQNLLTYLSAKGIGVSGFAYDDPGAGANLNQIGSIVQDLNGTPTTFAGGTKLCTDPGFGPGTMLRFYFRTGLVPAP